MTLDGRARALHAARLSARPSRPLAAVLAIQSPSWTVDAVCASVDADLWFPEKGGDSRPGKRVCMSCPVRAECLAYAIEHDVAYGIYGGLSAMERRRLRRGGAA